jgi:hypothetical protein
MDQGPIVIALAVLVVTLAGICWYWTLYRERGHHHHGRFSPHRDVRLLTSAQGFLTNSWLASVIHATTVSRLQYRS